MKAGTYRRRLSVFLALLFVPCAFAAQEPERWVEAHSPNFTVVSDAGEDQARRVLADFERFRSVIRAALPQLRVDPGKPVIIIAVKEAETLLRLLPGFRGGPERVRPSGAFIP